MGIEIIETKRLHIRPISVNDAEFVVELMNSPGWLKYIGDRDVHTIEEAKEYIKNKALVQLEAHGYTNNVAIRKVDNVKLGTLGIYHREGKVDPDLGFAFLPEFQGKSYAYEAAFELIRTAKNDYGLTELSAYTLEENKASRKLLERLGFKAIGKDNLPHDDAELLRYYRKLDL
ncbi:MAG: GNAT family N-acetyltransferase [Winogradskyella sp.]